MIGSNWTILKHIHGILCAWSVKDNLSMCTTQSLCSAGRTLLTASLGQQDVFHCSQWKVILRRLSAWCEFNMCRRFLMGGFGGCSCLSQDQTHNRTNVVSFVICALCFTQASDVKDITIFSPIPAILVAGTGGYTWSWARRKHKARKIVILFSSFFFYFREILKSTNVCPTW